MKLRLASALILAGLGCFSALAQEIKSDADASEPPTPEKVSYALGMNLGLRIKHLGSDVDVNVIAQAIKDVMEGKQTRISEGALRPIFKQEEAFQQARLSARNKIAGEIFLAQNATAPGITVLPNGLQYRVLEAGAGEIPKGNDIVIVKYKSKLIDGTEFDHSDHLQTPVAARIKGWQEALQRMKTGARWQIFVPPDLAYGHDWMRNVGPDSTLIFELELLSIEPPSGQPEPASSAGGLVHVIPQAATVPAANSTSPAPGK